MGSPKLASRGVFQAATGSRSIVQTPRGSQVDSCFVQRLQEAQSGAAMDSEYGPGGTDKGKSYWTAAGHFLEPTAGLITVECGRPASGCIHRAKN